MSTRAEFFSSKIRSLQDYQSQLAWITGSASYSTEICNILKYFKNVLTGILKDVSTENVKTSNSLGSSSRLLSEGSSLCSVTSLRNISYPTLGYFGLYETLLALMQKLSDIHNGGDELARELLDCLCLAMVFVDECTRIDLPANVAGLLQELDCDNAELQACFMNVLCRTIIPVCFAGSVSDDELSLSCFDDIPSIIITVLECVRDVSFHFQLIETLMLFKNDLWNDIMSVISWSGGLARVFATQLLFHYWPHLNPSATSGHTLSVHALHKNVTCQNLSCRSVSNTNAATTMILDPSFAARLSDKHPPLYLCHACTQENVSDKKHLKSLDVMLPAECIQFQCENKHCLAKDSVAAVTLLSSQSRKRSYGPENAFLEQKQNFSCHILENQIMRYCNECYSNLQHILGHLNMAVQLSPTNAWNQTNPQNTRTITDAIVCLLVEDVDFDPELIQKEATGLKQYNSLESVNGINTANHHEVSGRFGIYMCSGCAENVGMQAVPEMLSHFGVWLLVTLCPPHADIEDDIVAQLISSVLVWYKNNSRLSSDECGNRLENLKPLYLDAWLKEMYKLHFKEFLSCLLPNPPPDSRVRGHWDSIQPLWVHYREGLNLITCLSAYSIISLELWDCLIPCWMTTVCENLTAVELKLLEPSLNALFDKDLSPLSFRSENTFDFVFYNLKRSQLTDQENALEWLQVLCEVEVIMPLSVLLKMFNMADPHLSFDENLSPYPHENLHKSHSGLTEAELRKLISRDRIPQVATLESVFEAMNVSCNGSCHMGESEDQQTAPQVTPSESKRSFLRSGSMRAQKVMKSSSFLRSKRSSSKYRRAHSVTEQKDAERLRKHSKVQSADVSHDERKSPSTFRKLTAEWRNSRIIACYVDILDVIHQQILLQYQPKHEGLNNGQSANIAQLINDLLTHIVKNNEDRGNLHWTDTADPYIKAELELTGAFFELASNLLAYIVPSTECPWPDANACKHWTQSSSSFTVSMRKNKSPRTEDFDDCVLPIQLLYRLVKVLECYASDQVVTSHIVRCISLLCVNGNVLQTISASEEMVVRCFLSELFLPGLWKQLKVQNSDISRQVVPVLLRSANLIYNGCKVIMELFDAAFYAKPISPNDTSLEEWTMQFTAIDRIQAILLFTDECVITSRSPLTHVVAYALCLLLAALGQPSTAIYTKAKFVIDSLSTISLQIASHCLVHEFDRCVKDRTFVLTQLLQLHQLRPDTTALSFSLFSHIMDILAGEAELQGLLGIPFPFPANACGQKGNASTEQRSRDGELPGYRGGGPTSFLERIQTVKLDMEFGSMKKEQSGNVSMSSQCKYGNDNYEDTSTPMEAESQADHETVNHLMFVITKYMTGCENEMKATSTAKPFHAFLRQFHTWIGYNEQIGYFTTLPSVLRSTVGINTLLKNLPTIMDYNHTLGDILLPVVLAFLEVLVKSSDVNYGQTSSTNCEDFELDNLSEPNRQAWLKTVQVIMYKYVVTECMQREQLVHLLNICLHALQCEFHSCDGGGIGATQDAKTSKDSLNEMKVGTSDQHVSLDLDSSTAKLITSSISYSKETDQYERNGNEDTRPLLDNGQMLSNRHDVISDDCAGVNYDSLPYYDCMDDSVKDLQENRRNEENEMSSGMNPADTMFDLTENSVAGDLDIPAEINPALSDATSKSAKDALKAKSEAIDDDKTVVKTRCGKCNVVIKEFSDETLSMCILNLCQFVRFDETLAVPFLPKLLSQLALIAEPLWEEKCFDHRPLLSSMTHVIATAKQSIRCILHQLADNHIFTCLFLIPFSKDSTFLPVIMSCLKGYQKFPCVDVLKHALEGLPEDLVQLSSADLNCLLSNFATYLCHLPSDCPNSQWQPVLNGFCSFFMKLHAYILKHGMFSVDSILEVMTYLLKTPTFVNTKQSLLDPFTKILSISIPICNFSVQLLYNLCAIANEVFNKERDKLNLTRCIVSKLTSALKMNTAMCGQNLLLLLQMVLLDGGSMINPSTIQHFNKQLSIKVKTTTPCYAMECMRIYLTDCLDILGDGNFLNSVNDETATRGRQSHCTGLLKGLHGSELKLAVAQIVAGEMHNKPVAAFFPWLFQPPSTMQHGPKEYNECVAHIKKLSWVLLGALSHLGLQQGVVTNLWQPVPFDLGLNLASIVQVILTGYLEQTKEPTMNMSSLFYAFILCQLWTVYCEQLSYYHILSSVSTQGNATAATWSYNPVGDHHGASMLFEFWSRVTPSMLVLLEHDGMVSENIHRHIQSLIECLQQYDSSILFKLYPMWTPMLELRQNQVSNFDDRGKLHDVNLSETFNNSRGLPDYASVVGIESVGLDRNIGKINAQHLLTIVESINGKLVKIENGEGLCIV